MDEQFIYEAGQDPIKTLEQIEVEADIAAEREAEDAMEKYYADKEN